MVFHLVPHTHWDREWFLPLGALRARLVPMVDDLISRLARDPGFRTFLLDGQSVLLEDYLAVRPERRPEVAAMVAAGRLQTGPWYVLADEQIPTGESLVRNLLVGTAQASALGHSARAVYSPDAFGHPAVLPALGREFGLERGVLWRGLGARARGKDLISWVGPDGRALLIYHLPPAGYEIGGALPTNRDLLPQAWGRIRGHLIARAATRHVAVFVGADHHAAHPGLSVLREILAELEPAAEVRVSSLDELLASLASEATGVSEVSGELRDSAGYTWSLQGVHGTRAPLKRRHSLAELLLTRHTEPLVALIGDRSAGAVLAQAWRELLRCQFHDSICGTCADDVARALDVRLTDIEAAAGELDRTAIDALIGHDPDRARDDVRGQKPGLALWNPAGRTRGGVVTAEVTFFRQDIQVGPSGGPKPGRGRGYTEIALRDAVGKKLPLQVLDVLPGLERLDATRHYPNQDLVDVALVAFEGTPVRGLSVALLEPVASRIKPRGSVRATARRLGNREIELALARSGALSLQDRRSGERYGGLLTLESGRDIGDTYAYCPPKRERILRTTIGGASRLLTRGPLIGAVHLRRTLRLGRTGGDIQVGTTLELRSGERFLRLTLHLDNEALDHRLRLRVATGLSGPHAVAGTQFGQIGREPGETRCARSRAMDAGPVVEAPVSTDPAHRFVAVAQGSRGLAVLAPGFFEYELTPEGDLLITLLRAVGELSRPDLRTRPGNAGWPTQTPLAQCLGGSRIELAIAPIGAADAETPSRLEHLWEDAFVGLSPRWVRDRHLAGLPGESWIELEGEGLVFSALKPAEDGRGVILRCYNSLGLPVDGRWRLARAVARAESVRADETNLGSLQLTGDRRSIRFSAGPRGIVSTRIEFEG